MNRAIDRPLKNAMEGVGVTCGCEDCSNGGIFGDAVWEKRSADFDNDECDQDSF